MIKPFIPYKSPFTVISLLLTALIFWASLESIEHRYDFVEEHHAHHDCKQFDHLLDGVSHHVIAIDVFKSRYPLISFATFSSNIYIYYAFLARSPPADL